MADNRKTKKSSTSGLGFIIFLAFILISNIGEGEAIFPIIGIAALAVIIFIIVKAAKAKSAKCKAEPAPKKSTSSVYAEEKAKTAFRAAPAKANCSYGEDNCGYSHDEARRIKQLKDFLANGTIDRNEYNTLLQRYHREVEAANYHKQ